MTEEPMKRLLLITSSLLALTFGLASQAGAKTRATWSTVGTICTTVSPGPLPNVTHYCPATFTLSLQQVPVENNFNGLAQLEVTIHYDCMVTIDGVTPLPGACEAIDSAGTKAGCKTMPICQRQLALYLDGQRVRKIDLRKAKLLDALPRAGKLPNESDYDETWDVTFGIGTLKPLHRVGWHCLQVGMRSDQFTKSDPAGARSPAVWFYVP